MTNRMWTKPATLAAMLAATAVLSAQTQSPPPTQKPPDQRQTFSATAEAFTTSVTVRNAAGRSIPDLTLKDFEVLEDGVPQTIVQFVPVVGGRVMSEMAPTDEPPVTEGLIVPRTSRPPVQQGRIFIVFIDDLHIMHADTLRLKQILKDTHKILIHDGDLVGLVSSGYSSVSFDLSPDPRGARFNAAVEKSMGSGRTVQEILAAPNTMNGPAGLRHDAMVAFRTAYDILAQAEKVRDRRKAFIYISSGYDFNPYTNARYDAEMLRYAAPPPTIERGVPTRTDPLSGAEGMGNAVFRNPFEMNGQQFAEADLLAGLGELVRRARRANVEFHTIDPKGLVAGPDITANINAEDFYKHEAARISSLEVMCKETGGICGLRTNNFQDVLRRIDNQMSDYYIIGYQSNNPDPRKINRRIEVKVKRADAKQVIYTNWYMLKRR